MVVDSRRARLDQSRHHEQAGLSMSEPTTRRANGEKTSNLRTRKDLEIEELRKIIVRVVTPEKEEEIYRWYTTKREKHTKKQDTYYNVITKG